MLPSSVGIYHHLHLKAGIRVQQKNVSHINKVFLVGKPPGLGQWHHNRIQGNVVLAILKVRTPSSSKAPKRSLHFWGVYKVFTKVREYAVYRIQAHACC